MLTLPADSPSGTSTIHSAGSIATVLISFFLASCGGGRSSASLQSIQVTPATASLAAGLSQQFKAAGIYSDGSTRELTSGVTWTSSSTAIATVGANSGLVQSVTTGSTTIMATFDSRQGSAALNITAPVVQSVLVAPNSAGASIGATQQLRAIGVYSDGSRADVTYQVTWTSVTPAVATVVTTSGLVTGVSVGAATISAATGSVSGTSSMFIVAATWTAAGSLSEGRQYHSATLLANGTVFVTGGEGFNLGQIAVSSEIYAPATGAWTHNFPGCRCLQHTATLLQNGQVLIAGGAIQTMSYTPINTASLFDPATQSIASTGSMVSIRRRH